jgi:CrcB protein
VVQSARVIRDVDGHEEALRVEPWVKVVVLSLGGALGVNARYWLGVWMSGWASPRFPWATFTINVSGSFAIGFLSVFLVRWLPHPNLPLLILVGFLGSYTTFSTFALDSLSLWARGTVGLSLANMFGSLAAGLGAVAMGVALARAVVIAPPERSPGDAAEIRVRVDPQGPALPLVEPGFDHANEATP